MEKTMYFALSVALAFILSVNPLNISNAEAASKSYSKSKVVKYGKKRVKKSKRRRVTGGGGCQSLSASTLETKASQYSDSIASASSQYGVSKNLIKAVITIESCFKSSARGSLGEKGLMQLMPGTARRFNIRNGYNAWENIHGGTRYLSYLLAHYDGNIQRAVAAYNAGEGNVRKNGRIPNKSYVSKVMQAYGKFADGNAPVFVADKAYKPSATAKPVANVRQAGYTAQKSAPQAGKALPWKDIHALPAQGKTSRYRVKTGDTVYEVMRQTGVPVKTIIRLNRLPAPYHVKAGQTLRLN